MKCIISILCIFLLVPLTALAAEIQLIPSGNKVPGVYEYGPISLPDAATRFDLEMSRTNIFAKPDIRVRIIAMIFQGETRVGGCVGTIEGGTITFRGQPVMFPAGCGQALPELPGLHVEGSMEVSGDSAVMGLVLKHD